MKHVIFALIGIVAVEGYMWGRDNSNKDQDLHVVVHSISHVFGGRGNA